MLDSTSAERMTAYHAPLREAPGAVLACPGFHMGGAMPNLEEVMLLIRSARAVATLSHSDNAFDEVLHREAAGAVAALLGKVEALLEA